MKKLFLFLSLILIQSVSAQELEMFTNWDEAKEHAQNEQKNILVILTGSEWCAPCKKMDDRVIASEEFQRYANDNLVIFLVDLPGGGLHLNSTVYKAYSEFKKRYEAERLPSLVLTDSYGKKIKTLKGKMFKLENVLEQLKEELPGT